MSAGRKMRIKLIPAAFIASSSNRSPIFPKEIREANNNAKGNEMGTSVIEA